MSKGPTHRHPTTVKFLSLLFLCRFAGSITFFILAGNALYFPEENIWLWATGGCALIWIILSLIHLLENSRCCCSVCTTPLFEMSRKKGRRIHARTKSLLGSYRLNRSLSVLFKNYYHCNHCGERVSCAAPHAQAHSAPSAPSEPAKSEVPEDPAIPPKATTLPDRPKIILPGSSPRDARGRRIG